MCIHVQKEEEKKKKKVAIYSPLSPGSGESRLSMVIVKKKIKKNVFISISIK